MGKPKGYFKYILAMDCETSGLAFGSDSPCYDEGGYYQPLSWGMLVLNADTLEEIERLYVEIKWDGVSLFDERTVKVHGLSKDHLEREGVSEEDACVMIGSMIMKYWETTPVVTLGHNVVSFDLPFLKEMMRRHGIELSFGNRHVDTNGAGFIALGSYTSDELFDIIGLDQRQEHNALEDIVMTVEAARSIRLLVNEALGI